jgi:solute:Na+ symporter, SSS family
MLELTIIILYFLSVAAIGLASRQRHWRLDDFLVAGRKYSTFFIAASLLATIIGGSATVGLAGLGYSRGLSGAWWLLVGCLGLIALGLLFAAKVRNFGLFTLPQIIARQYDRRVSLAASILIVVAWIGVTAGQILAAGKILSALGMGSPALWMIIFTLIFVSYTLVGGQFAIIRTDILDIVIIFAGIFTAAGILLHQTGGLNAMLGSLPADKTAFPLSPNFGPLDLVSYFLLVGLTYVVGPDMYSRLFCAKNGRTAKIAVFWAALFLVPLAFTITFLGMGALALKPGISPEQALPALFTGVLPAWAAGLVMAALISAIMSTADATLLSAGTILSVDIVGFFKKPGDEKQALRRSRWCLTFIGLAALGLALLLKGVISALLFAYTIYTCGVILPVIAGFYKDRLHVTSHAALAAICGGGLTGLVSRLWSVRYLDLAALGVSFLLLTGVSLIENRFMARRRANNN